MGKMKKAALAWAVVCALLVALVGCGRGAGGKGGASSSPSSSPGSSAVASETAPPETDSPEPVQTTDKIPVLMYHSLQYDPSDPQNSARIRAEEFAAQMKWLHDNGYQAVSLDRLYQGLSSGGGFPSRSVVLTFDDGYGDFYTNGYPVLRQYGFAATVFMISGEVGKAGYLTADQLRDISSGGVEVEDHTVTHPHLGKLSYDAQLGELSDSRTALQGITGGTVQDIAYPYGEFGENTLRAARALGYRMGFKMQGGWAAVGDNILEIPRVYIGGSLDAFVTKVTKVTKAQ